MFAQNTLRTEQYIAYILNDVSRWEKLTHNYEQKADLTKVDNLLALIGCYYGYTATLLEKKQMDKVKNSIEKAESYIAKVLTADPNNAVAIDYSGAFLSYTVSMNKMKAPTLGKQSRSLIDKAYSLDANNPQILMDKGNALFYPPKLFGGNKKEALVFYQKAISIIEQSKETTSNWIYLKLLLLQARVYEATDDPKTAKKFYENLLKIEPNFMVVKNKFYPELLKKM